VPIVSRRVILAAAWTSPSTSLGRRWALVLLEWVLPTFTGEGVIEKKIARGTTASNPGQSCPFNSELEFAITL